VGNPGLETGESECSQACRNGFALPRRLELQPLVPMDYQPPPFFSRGPAPLARLGFFACLAVLLMVLDARFDTPSRCVRSSPCLPIRCSARRSLRRSCSAPPPDSHDTGVAQAGERAAQGKAAAGGERPAHVDALRAEERAAEATARGARASAASPPRWRRSSTRGADPFSRKVIIDKGKPPRQSGRDRRSSTTSGSSDR